MRFLIIVLFLALPAMADELILKDGKKIEWKLLSDEGDTYEVSTPQGTKVTVKKDDVERLAKSRLPEVLTGATFTFDKKRKLETVDLFTKIDPKKDVVGGSWKFVGSSLVGTRTGADNAKLQIGFTPQEEYDLMMTIERKETLGDAPGIMIGLIGGGKQFGFFLDRAGGLNGPTLIDGQNNLNNGLGIPGKFFEKGKPRTIVFMVRKEALIVMVDGKDYFSWKADWNKVSVEAFFAVQSKNTLFLAIESATFQIQKAVVTTPKAQP